MHKGDIGAQVGELQRLLKAAGFKIAVTSVFDDATEAAVIALQSRAGLVADGIAGPKTLAALQSRDRDPRRLSESDLEAVAERLGVQVAAIKAVNNVESRGSGFFDDGRPVILYERHVMYQRLKHAGQDADTIAARFPAFVSQQRGGYVGGSGEYSRLANASSIDRQCALESCSWGQFQIMGYHWSYLGYASIEEFVGAMQHSEADQLEAFCRFILADAALLKALRARKWAEFARAYNGPAFRENLYDAKLARAYERFSPAQETADHA